MTTMTETTFRGYDRAGLDAQYPNALTVANGGTGASTLTGYVKGTGTTPMTAAATIPFADVDGRANISAFSTADQTGSVSVATAVTFTDGLTGTGISISGSQITFTAAGTYMLAPSFQFKNTDTASHDVTFWFRKNGANIANSASIVNVPKTADGGLTLTQIVVFETVTAGQNIEIMWLPENVAVTLDATAAGAIAPAVPSVILVAQRVA